MDFLLVIPAYHESERLPRYLETLADALEKQAYRTAILVVDDGSSRQEQERLLACIQSIVQKHKNVLPPVLLSANRGKGGAILAGWDYGFPARWLSFVDADGAIPACEVVRLFSLVAGTADEERAVFASRVKMLGRTVTRSAKRHLTGRVFAFLVGYFIDSRVYDSQCGFKIVPAGAFAAIRGQVTEVRFAFDVELLALLLKSSIPVEEVPIDWIDQPGSKVSFLRDTFRMFRSLLRIRSTHKLWTSSKKTT
jgi:glycosyltransferase involved in cell wall biosynthesis